MLIHTLLIYPNPYKIKYKISVLVCQMMSTKFLFLFLIDLGSVICLFLIKRYGLEIPIIFVSWRGRNSLRPFVSHSSRKFYFSLCNIDPTKISKYNKCRFFLYWLFVCLDTIIDQLTIEEKSNNPKTDESWCLCFLFC